MAGQHEHDRLDGDFLSGEDAVTGPDGTRRKDERKGIDQFVGRRIAEFRVAKGLTQEALAQLLDRSPNDVQRFEKGARANAGVLLQIAGALDCDVSDLFHGARVGDGEPGDVAAKGERVTLEISRAVARINSPHAKTALLELARAIGDAEQRGSVMVSGLTELVNPAVAAEQGAASQAASPRRRVGRSNG